MTTDEEIIKVDDKKQSSLTEEKQNIVSKSERLDLLRRIAPWAALFSACVGFIVLYNTSEGFSRNPLKYKFRGDNNSAKVVSEREKPNSGSDSNSKSENPRIKTTNKLSTSKPATIFIPSSVKPTDVLRTDYTARYIGLEVPENSWFGKVELINKHVDDTWNVIILSEPRRAIVSLQYAKVARDVQLGDFVEVTGKIEEADQYIVLTEANIIKTNRHDVLVKTRPNYENISCVQKRLKEYGFGPHYVDGIAGKNTQSAINRFLSRSSILDELGLTKTASIDEICAATKDITKTDYKNLVNKKNEDAWTRRREEQSAKDLEYEESRYQKLVDADKAALNRAISKTDDQALIEFLNFDHMDYKSGDKVRLKASEGHKERREEAIQALGVTFDPAKQNKLEVFINDDKASGTNYEVDITVGKDSGYKFHPGKELHGISTCLNGNLLRQCVAGGVCTDKDKKLHADGRTKSCVDLEVYYTFINLIVDRDVRDGLCERFTKYINKKTGHRGEHAIKTEYGVHQCYIHYDKQELSRLFE